MGLLAYIPVAAKLIVWICVAHLWIVLCSIGYVRLEGFDITSQMTQQVDLYLGNVFSGDTKHLQHRKSKEYISFKNGYDAAVKHQEYWLERNKFNDISNVYVFVLSIHTTIGSHGLRLQTWQSQLFYIFTVPIGMLLYFLMIHYIVSECFEIIAYAAVLIYKKRSVTWSEDQRELYEKLKITVLTLFMLLLAILMFALIFIFNDNSYLSGLYYTLSLAFTINASPEIGTSHVWSSDTMAVILTLVYFNCMIFLYAVLYSLFILFRYNDFDDIIGLYYDNSISIDGYNSTDEEEIRQRSQSALYFQAKAAAQDIGSKPPLLHSNLSNQVAKFPISDEAREMTVDNDSIGSRITRKRLKRFSRLVMQDIDPDEEAPLQVPSIEVTSATPPAVPMKNPFPDDASLVSSFDSDCSNISVKDHSEMK